MSVGGGDAVNISAFGVSDALLWQTTVHLDTSVGLMPYWDFAWKYVPVNVGGILALKFDVDNPMWPSIDDMVINQTTPVPLPSAALLFGSGLVMVGGRMAWDRRRRINRSF